MFELKIIFTQMHLIGWRWVGFKTTKIKKIRGWEYSEICILEFMANLRHFCRTNSHLMTINKSPSFGHLCSDELEHSCKTKEKGLSGIMFFVYRNSNKQKYKDTERKKKRKKERKKCTDICCLYQSRQYPLHKGSEIRIMREYLFGKKDVWGVVDLTYK